METLHNYIDKNCLPKDYAGNNPAIDYSGRNWFACIENHIDFFIKWNEYGFVSNKSL